MRESTIPTRASRGSTSIMGAWMVMLLLLQPTVVVEALAPTKPTSSDAQSHHHDATLQPIISEVDNNSLSRRTLISQGTVALVAATATSLLPLPPPATAAATAEDDQPGLMTATQVADLLKPVPTFTIVDQQGVPFMVVGEDAKVTGYFFTTYGEASRLLKLAKTSADKALKAAKAEGQEDVGDNPWNKARISTVPLDFAVTLNSVALQSRVKNYFQIAPAETDIDDALAITGKKSLAEGKVPLFYMKDFLDANGKSPLYFRKSELIQDFQKANAKGTEVPEVLVSELFAVLIELVKPGGTDQELKDIVLVAPRESAQKAQQCRKAGGKESPFLLGQRNVIL